MVQEGTWYLISLTGAQFAGKSHSTLNSLYCLHVHNEISIYINLQIVHQYYTIKDWSTVKPLHFLWYVRDVDSRNNVFYIYL